MVKPSCKVKAENCEASEWEFAGQQMASRKRVLKTATNFKSLDIVKPSHKRSARLSAKAAARATSPLPEPDMLDSHEDLGAALLSTEELVSDSLFDPSIDDCWFQQVNTILPDIDELSAELDLDDISCSSGGSDCTIPDTASFSTSLDDLEEPKPKLKKERKVTKSRANPTKAVHTVPPPVPQIAHHPTYSAALSMQAPMRLSIAKTVPGTGKRIPYQYTGVTLSIGGRRSSAYTRKPLAVHGGHRIRAHLGFAANLAAVCASGM